MEFRQRTGKRKSRVVCNYPCALQLYKLPPTEVVSLQEFEELAEKRLRRERASRRPLAHAASSLQFCRRWRASE